MKTLHNILFSVFAVLAFSSANSQVNIVSSNGYTVNVVIQPKAIITSTNNCTWGYNYNLRLDYSVTFTGNNIPGSLYTLQGTFGCGSASHFFSLPLNGGNGTVITQSNAWRSSSDCASATLTSLQCNTVQLITDGPGISNGIVSFNVSANPLPVKLTSFNVAAAGQQVAISWETASEENNDYFSIERSGDGQSWTLVKRIPGHTNQFTPAEYTITDTDPLPGLSYYRLKQTDLDGKSTYSETRQVRMLKSSGITIYPVPNSGRTLYFQGITDPRNVNISIRNTAGLLLFDGQLTSSSIELPKLNPGLYFISLQNKSNGTLQHEKYIQQ